MSKGPQEGPVRRAGRFEEALAVLALAALAVITLGNVVTRYLVDEPLAWTEEISVFLLVILALAGSSAVARRDGHIRIEFFFMRKAADGTEVPRRALQHFSALATSVLFMAMAGLFARWVWDQYRFDETSMGLGVPLWWFGAPVPLLCLLISARFFQWFTDLRGRP